MGGEPTLGDSNFKHIALGDFQTPPSLASHCVEAIASLGIPFQRMIEPCCGDGNFMAAAVDALPSIREIRGVEIQRDRVYAARQRLSESVPSGVGWSVDESDLFDLDLSQFQWGTDGPLLVLGNPPWVMASRLAAAGVSVEAARQCVRQLLPNRLTRAHSADFDLAEAVWVKALVELRAEAPMIAMLVKQSTARRLAAAIGRLRVAVDSATAWEVNAKQHFGVSVGACLLALQMRVPGAAPLGENGAFFGELGDIGALGQSLLQRSPIEWRQGIKHDLAAVMELEEAGTGVWRNGLGELVDVEDSHVYPLLKATDLHMGRAPSRRVIVTQRFLSERTSCLERTSPRLWNYLVSHRDRFAERRSGAYRGRPEFCMFGVGDYTFAPWKVAVSGLHQDARFRVVGPVENRPVVLDDTCYFWGCDDPGQAVVVSAALRMPAAQEAISTLMPTGTKRSVTKRLLQRVDLDAIMEDDRGSVVTAATAILQEMGYESHCAHESTECLLSQWRVGTQGTLFAEPRVT